jgi:hypothetical protein
MPDPPDTPLEENRHRDPAIAITLPHSAWLVVARYLAVGQYREVAEILRVMGAQADAQLRALKPDNETQPAQSVQPVVAIKPPAVH